MESVLDHAWLEQDLSITSMFLFSRRFRAILLSCPALQLDIKKMASVVQMAVLRQLCCINRSVTYADFEGSWLKSHGCIGGGVRSLSLRAA